MDFAIRQERQGERLTMFLTGEFNKLAMDVFDKEFLLATEGVKVYVESLSEEGLEERKQELKRPYDLIDRPLYRVNIIKTPESKYIYLDFYHAIMDGAAIALLFWREMEKRYVHGNEAAAAKRQPPSYADYVRDEAELPEEELAKGRAYWQALTRKSTCHPWMEEMGTRGRIMRWKHPSGA